MAEDTRSLSEAMEKGLDSNTSAFAANVVVANIMARNMLRLHRLIADQTSRDAILELYRHMNNMLSRIFLTMPRHLGVAAGLRSSSIVHMQLVLHATSISLHQATVQKIGVQNLDETAIQRAEDRCLIAAEEIVDILRMTAHIQPEKVSRKYAPSKKSLAHTQLDESLHRLSDAHGRDNLRTQLWYSEHQRRDSSQQFVAPLVCLRKAPQIIRKHQDAVSSNLYPNRT